LVSGWPEAVPQSGGPRPRSTHQRALPAAEAEGFLGLRVRRDGRRYSAARGLKGNSCLRLGSMLALVAHRRPCGIWVSPDLTEENAQGSRMAYSSWLYLLVSLICRSEVLACCRASMPATSESLSRMLYCPNPRGACDGLPAVASISTAWPGGALSSTPGRGGGDSARGRSSSLGGLYASYPLEDTFDTDWFM